MTLRERLQQAKHDACGMTFSSEDDFILWFVERELRDERRAAIKMADELIANWQPPLSLISGMRNYLNKGAHQMRALKAAERARKKPGKDGANG